MGIPIHIYKIKNHQEQSKFIIEIQERGNQSRWDKTYTANIKELIKLKEDINRLIDNLTLGEKLNLSKEYGEKIEKFYTKESLCNNCKYKNTETCIECVLELQSPIERTLFLELKKRNIWFRTQYGINYNGENIYTKDKSYNNPKNNFKEVLTIADFYISNSNTKLCVYTDGHTYHERTEDQAVRDRKIDRKLQEFDYKVLRFTGKEVNDNIEKIVTEIEKWLNKENKRYK